MKDQQTSTLEPGNYDIKSFAKSLADRGKQPATIESYCRDAQQFLDFLVKHSIPIGDVEPSILLAFQKHLIEQGAAKENSLRRAVIGIRQYFRFVAAQSRLSTSPLDGAPIPDRVELLPGERMRQKIMTLMSQIVHSEKTSLISSRNAAIIALLGLEGLKASELIQLRWTDLFDHSTSSLSICGNRKRTIILHHETSRLLSTYRTFYNDLRHRALEHAEERSIFISFKGRDASHLIPHVTRHGIKFILYEVGRQGGIKHLNTELLRHHAIGFLLSQGKSPEDVMHHLGLRRIGLVKRYLAHEALTAPETELPTSMDTRLESTL